MKRLALSATVTALILGSGLLTGLAFAGTAGNGNKGASRSQKSSTTTPSTTTTVPTTTTGPAVTSTTTQPPVAQTTTQAQTPHTTTSDPSQGTTSTSTPTTTTTTPPPTTTSPTTTTPTATCDTIQLSCGNNAATQVALVSQVCTATSANSVLNVTIQTLAGTPVNNVTINPTTTCLNQLQITQVVEQYCVGCTVIVIPPPTPAPVYITGPIEAPAAVTTTVMASPSPQAVMAYCMPQSAQAGAPETLMYLPVGEPQRDSSYASATAATYSPTAGMSCPSSTVASHVPLFTLTVPASFVGQFVSLCIQPDNPAARPSCHTIRIDNGATISVPVTSNVVAKVTKKTLTKAEKPKSKQAIKTASKLFAIVSHVSAKKVVLKHPKPKRTVASAAPVTRNSK